MEKRDRDLEFWLREAVVPPGWTVRSLPGGEGGFPEIGRSVSWAASRSVGQPDANSMANADANEPALDVSGADAKRTGRAKEPDRFSE